MASYGLTNQVLTLYLKSIHVSEYRIGLFMTLTLIGDTTISYFLTWNADKIGRKLVMLIGSLMMMISGLAFMYSTNYYILLFAAIVGVISPSGDETGPFKSIEEASIAHLTSYDERAEVFAIYGVFATTGSALGSLICGFLVDFMHLDLNWSLTNSYQYIFIVYSIIALIKFTLMSFLSKDCEISDENTKLLDDKLSSTTKHHLPRLLIIFMLDSLGYGFMPSAWIVYYLKFAFNFTAKGLGTLFFITNSVDAISSIPSAYFAKALGPVKAIIFTQAPSAILFGLIAFCQNYIYVIILLILYYTTTTMDVVPRQLLLTSIMPKNEITKVMGIVNIGKTFARCIGPIFTGRLAEHSHLKYSFIISASCTLLADLILGISFLHVEINNE
ncbi:uncharacterized protein KGF55_005739 [Candida pseudojiufengensis]|uniref:uncharacterized protein n=1 Tax=Candida pseudojiufengensis TaxID=497109 RepID=UPI002225850C|nr:uncharacterized protein KGF55_005739 [Candida pseudojiufengensis]KAI5958740.1 hypothetical protein KGF55_005739 [Candida pseudojiufengensis]